MNDEALRRASLVRHYELVRELKKPGPSSQGKVCQKDIEPKPNHCYNCNNGIIEKYYYDGEFAGVGCNNCGLEVEEEDLKCTCGAEHTSNPNSHAHWCDKI